MPDLDSRQLRDRCKGRESCVSCSHGSCICFMADGDDERHLPAVQAAWRSREGMDLAKRPFRRLLNLGSSARERSKAAWAGGQRASWGFPSDTADLAPPAGEAPDWPRRRRFGSGRRGGWSCLLQRWYAGEIGAEKRN